MNVVKVSLKNGSNYSVFISDNIFEEKDFVWPFSKGEKVMLVTNDYLFSSVHFYNLFNKLISIGIYVEKIILPEGEKCKSLNYLDSIFTKLLKSSYGRNSTLVAFGGGVIGDLTGFAASVYQRGIRLVQIPTTLLAQVDASIGGKTGINHILGKNMIGSFYQPSCVIINLGYLDTLSNRNFCAGLSEIIKYGIILDYDFFLWIEKHIEKLLNRKLSFLLHCVTCCCKLKISVIEKDEKEVDKFSNRILLNLGHTYAHAIESYTKYCSWLHGEAVSSGIIMALKTAYYINQFTSDDFNRVKSLFVYSGLPIYGPKDMSFDDYLYFMKRDKKSFSDGRLRLVVPVGLGKGEVRSDISYRIIEKSINKNDL